MKKIAIATTGGDAPGMNAAIRAVVRTSISKNIDVIGFERGYAGLLNNELRELDARSVGGLIYLGGTFLKTARTDKMLTDEGILKASKVLKENRIEGLIVIGGDGSFRGACKLYENSGIPIIGIPATIDNDLAGTDTTIGFDTAVNTAIDAIDKIRDTATSHERVFIIEVMGRKRGFIALEVGIGAGAEIIIIPEIKCNIKRICEKMSKSHIKGKESGIIVMAEGAKNCKDVVETIKKETKFEVRLSRLGYIQRGGRPTAYSRLLACRMGAASVDFLIKGKKKVMTGIVRNELIPVDLEYASHEYKPINKRLYELSQILSI
jgi:6-phosphofructokinase 1